MKEPLIHSHITDLLPDEHRLCWEDVYCEKCKVMLHAHNNECMRTWVESGNKNYCIKCFAEEGDSALWGVN